MLVFKLFAYFLTVAGKINLKVICEILKWVQYESYLKFMN